MTNNNNRHWLGKYWKENNISDIIQEIVDPSEVDISSIITNEELNPVIWNFDKTLKRKIRKVLLKNALMFIKFSDVENLKFDDIILTGSMANYNYNKYSDIDIHIVLDFRQISENKEFVTEFFKMKKRIWSDTISPKIKGHDIELYFQDNNENHYSSGVYSIIHDKWIRKPIKKIINIDAFSTQLKTANIMNDIDNLESNINDKDFLGKYETLKNKIKNYRKSGLSTVGEYSIENFVFKILRNSGYLEKLFNLKNRYLKKELSMDENQKQRIDIF